MESDNSSTGSSLATLTYTQKLQLQSTHTASVQQYHYADIYVPVLPK